MSTSLASKILGSLWAAESLLSDIEHKAGTVANVCCQLAGAAVPRLDVNHTYFLINRNMSLASNFKNFFATEDDETDVYLLCEICRRKNVIIYVHLIKATVSLLFNMATAQRTDTGTGTRTETETTTSDSQNKVAM